MPMLELEPSALRRLRDEAHLDLARPVEIALELPLRADVPRERQSFRRLVGQYPCPPALAAVDPAVVDVAADARLEDGLGDVDGKQVVLARLDPIELLDTRKARSMGAST